MAMGCDSKSASEGKVSGAIANEEHKAQQEKQEKEEQVWEDVDSDDQNTFFLDPEGRVPFAGEVSFGFRCAPRALASALSEPGVLTRVVADCQTVFSARAKKLEYSTGETFWVPADAEPRNCLETLALDIFRAHTGNARFNRATSGAEWWSQVIEDTDDIGWHWDKDYGMEARGINVHPCLATVTYLSADGGPTVILEKKGPMTCEDVDGVSGEAGVAWISRPQLGKHICFDGRYLHAAPADLALPLAEEQGQTCLSSSAAAAAVAIAGGHDLGTASTTTTATTAAVSALPKPEPPAAAPEAGAAAATVAGTKRSNCGEPKVAVFSSNGATSSVAPSAACAKAPPPPTGIAAVAAMETGGTIGNNSTSSGGGTGSGSRSSSSGSRRRVTFLVNVWLNHTPKTASRLPDATAAALSSTRLAANLTDDGFVPSRVLRVNQPEVLLATNSAAGGRSREARESGKDGRPAEGGGSGVGGAACDLHHCGEECRLLGLGGVADSAGSGEHAGCEGGRHGVDDNTGSKRAVGVEEGGVVPVVDVRWEFGEVGDEAAEQVHLQYEVLVPVPVELLQSPTPTPTSSTVEVGGRGGAGGEGAGSAVGAPADSFRVEYLGSRRPRVTRVSGGESSSEDGSESGSESGSGSDEEECDEEVEYGKDDEEEGEGEEKG